MPSLLHNIYLNQSNFFSLLRFFFLSSFFLSLFLYAFSHPRTPDIHSSSHTASSSSTTSTTPRHNVSLNRLLVSMQPPRLQRNQMPLRRHPALPLQRLHHRSLHRPPLLSLPATRFARRRSPKGGPAYSFPAAACFRDRC